MNPIARRWFAIGALLAALGVAFGAFGAHFLRGFLEGQGHAGDDLARRLANFDTAVRYQMLHAIAIILAALALDKKPSICLRFAAWAFLVGVVLFCGLLKVLVFASPDWRWLGAVVPWGGGAMIAGWIALAIGAYRHT